MIDNLQPSRAPQPIYEGAAEARSGKLPGAVVTLNPYAAAFHFVMAGRDLDQDAKTNASKIADAVVSRMAATP